MALSVSLLSSLSYLVYSSTLACSLRHFFLYFFARNMIAPCIVLVLVARMWIAAAFLSATLVASSCLVKLDRCSDMLVLTLWIKAEKSVFRGTTLGPRLWRWMSHRSCRASSISREILSLHSRVLCNPAFSRSMSSFCWDNLCKTDVSRFTLLRSASYRRQPLEHCDED